MTAIGFSSPAVDFARVDLCGPALQAGWRHAEVLRPGELLCGAAMLTLAGQSIPVRLVVNLGDDAAPLLAQLHYDVLQTLFLEQFIVMVAFPPAAVQAYQATFHGVTTRRVTVGTTRDYRAWLQARLGPVGRLSLSSPVRRLTEHLLCLSSAPEPREKCPIVVSDAGSPIKESFDLGAAGVQAVATLLTHTRGAAGVINVESSKAWRAKDVDLLVRESAGAGGLIQVEVKNEEMYTGNIALETYSNFERKTPGWFRYSTADVLATSLWLSGDLILTDLAMVRKWFRTTPRKLEKKYGTVPKQRYHSELYPAPIIALLLDLPCAVHLRLEEWLPTLYAGQFAKKSLVPPWLPHKTLRPQRHNP